ncbi:TlyA family RNA methyltransferase [Angelakisella massiliensis]|uniref:TlyA family RNA methyltransferase n=1 Tax=Angelakisella massiliensis TaxID=1871018 RepID=UPI0008F9422C|nr:TlyA family RNA methyltransferase [Angelakisella massiliensis]
MEKKRLDAAVVERGLVSGRDRAKGIIMAGQVYVNQQKADKPGQLVSETDQIEVRGETLRYVSRGGLKLEKSMETFPITLQDCVCGDIGASTGGFTDCMLQNGASKVYAIDVGYGQLAWKLRTDPRVVNLERTNVRYLTEEQVPEQLDFISIDVSFISLALVLPVAWKFLKNDCKVVCLVKPQFEAGRELVGKKGVVRDPATHLMVLEKILGVAWEIGLRPMGLTYSPVRGPEGNIEYLLFLSKEEGEPLVTAEDARLTVEQSHQELDH